MRQWFQYSPHLCGGGITMSCFTMISIGSNTSICWSANAAQINSTHLLICILLTFPFILLLLIITYFVRYENKKKVYLTCRGWNDLPWLLKLLSHYRCYQMNSVKSNRICKFNADFHNIKQSSCKKNIMSKERSTKALTISKYVIL